MFAEPNVSFTPKEFQAVILAGNGEELSPLTSDNLPKALLPIGNKPIVEGVLKWIEEAYLHDVLLVAPATQEGQLSAFVRSRRAASESQLRITLETYDEEEIQGTAQVLRWAYTQRHIKHDSVILPCDLHLLPSVQGSSNGLSNLLDVHRLRDNLLTTLYYERTAANEERLKDGPSPVLTFIEPTEDLLLDSKDLADYEDDVNLRSSLFKKYQKALLTTSLLPTHVYILSLRALKILEAIPTFQSIKEDFVPFLCKLQWQTLLLKKYSDNPLLRPQPHPQAMALSSSSTQEGEPDSGDVRCGVRIWKKSDGFCARANTVEAVHEIHRVVLPILSAAQKQSTPAASTKQIGSDSLAGANLQAGERTTIKKSSVGKNVQMGSNCKITSSIVMDGVVLGDSIKLDGCIVCPHAQIASGCNLTKCEVAFKAEVAANTVAKGEKVSD